MAFAKFFQGSVEQSKMKFFLQVLCRVKILLFDGVNVIFRFAFVLKFVFPFCRI